AALREAPGAAESGARPRPGALPDMTAAASVGARHAGDRYPTSRPVARMAGSYGIVLLLACGSSAAADVTRAPYVPDSGDLAVRCGTLIDGLADQAAKDRLVLIRHGRFAAVVDG